MPRTSSGSETRVTPVVKAFGTGTYIEVEGVEYSFMTFSTEGVSARGWLRGGEPVPAPDFVDDEFWQSISWQMIHLMSSSPNAAAVPGERAE